MAWQKNICRGPLEIRLVNQKNNVKSPCIAGTTWPNVQPVANLWSMLTATRCQEQRENAMMLTRTVENILHIGIFECTMAIAVQLFLCKHCAYLPTVARSFGLPVAGTLKLQKSRFHSRQ